MKDEAEFKLKPYTAKELAAMYEVSLNTFKKWVREYDASIGPNGTPIGPKVGRYFNVRQMEIIIAQFGFPRIIKLGDWNEAESQ